MVRRAALRHLALGPDALGDAEPVVLSIQDGFEFERIAAAKPDLIIGTNAGMTKEDYEKLSAIAPTIAHTGKYASEYFEPWDEQALTIGRAVGKDAEMTEIVEGITARFAEEAAAHPERAGTTAVFLQNAFYDGNAIAYPVLDDGEVLLWGTEAPADRTALEANTLFRRLEAVKAGKIVYTDATTAGAIYFTSPLSLPYLLDRLVPALETAVAGKGPVTAS